MADQLQLRGGTTSEILVATGAQREVFVNTDNHTLVVQDGITAGGFPTATSAQVTDGTFYYNENVGSIANAYLLDAKPNTNTPGSYKDGVQFGFITTHPNTGPSTANFQSLGVKSLKFPGGVDPQSGELSGRIYLIYDAANGWLEIQRRATGAPPQLRTVSASVASNALTVGLQPATIDFRSSSPGSGTVNTRVFSSALSLTVPASATLGTVNGVQNQIAILALDNAGTVQLGVINAAGGLNFDESTLINATAVTSGSNSANVVYSTSAVSGVPFRVVGYLKSTQAVAGTWTAAPSDIQGQGGQTLLGFARMTLSTTQPTTSGTAVEYTGIPPGTKKIIFMLNGVSTNGVTAPIIQLGSGSPQTTGYVGSFGVIVGSTVSSTASTTGFAIGAGSAAATYGGSAMFTHMGGNVWTAQGSVNFSNQTAISIISGYVTLSGVLDRIRITATNGTDTFDAGSINIIFEG